MVETKVRAIFLKKLQRKSKKFPKKLSGLTVCSNDDMTKEEQDLIAKASALTLNDQDNGDTQKEETELIDNPEFLGEIIKELDIDPEDDFVKNLVGNNDAKKDEAEGDKKPE